MLWIRMLDQQDETQSDKIVLGARFLQMFEAYWAYNTETNGTVFSMMKSSKWTGTGYDEQPPFIGTASYTVASKSPFTVYKGKSKQLPLTVDPMWLTVTVSVDIGYMGQDDFLINQLSTELMTFAQDCTSDVWGSRFEQFNGQSCSKAPVMANNYFNVDYWSPSQFYTAAETKTIAGYYSDGEWVYTQVCLDQEKVFCTLGNEKTYTANVVRKDHWNLLGNATSGTIGFGSSSPVWKIIDDPNKDHFEFDIDMTSFVDWTFIESDYTQTTTDNLINFGAWSSSYTEEMANLMIVNNQYSNSEFTMTEFGFGSTNATNQYYESILNTYNVDETENNYQALYGAQQYRALRNVSQRSGPTHRLVHHFQQPDLNRFWWPSILRDVPGRILPTPNDL
jgi:hypothetical protein